MISGIHWRSWNVSPMGKAVLLYTVGRLKLQIAPLQLTTIYWYEDSDESEVSMSLNIRKYLKISPYVLFSPLGSISLGGLDAYLHSWLPLIFWN